MPLPLLLLLLLDAEPSQAVPEPVHALRWTAPSSCPTQPQVVDRIEGLLAGSTGPGVRVTAEATVERAGERWMLTLRISTSSGSRTRTVETEDCDELASVAAWSIATAVDPGLTGLPAAPPEPAVPAEVPTSSAEAAPPEPEGPPEPEAPVEPASPPEPAPSVEPEAPARAPASAIVLPSPVPPGSTDAPGRALHGSITARVGLSTGVLPSVAPTVRLGGGPWWGRFGAQATVVHRLPRRVGGGRAELWTLAADLRGCAAPQVRAVSFPLCLGAELGAIAGRSLHVSNPGRGHAPWIALEGSGGLVTMIGRRLGITIDVGLLLPVVRAGFEIEGVGELHRVGPVGLDASIGVEVIFP